MQYTAELLKQQIKGLEVENAVDQAEVDKKVRERNGRIEALKKASQETAKTNRNMKVLKYSTTFLVILLMVCLGVHCSEYPA